MRNTLFPLSSSLVQITSRKKKNRRKQKEKGPHAFSSSLSLFLYDNKHPRSRSQVFSLQVLCFSLPFSFFSLQLFCPLSRKNVDFLQMNNVERRGRPLHLPFPSRRAISVSRRSSRRRRRRIPKGVPHALHIRRRRHSIVRELSDGRSRVLPTPIALGIALVVR